MSDVSRSERGSADSWPVTAQQGSDTPVGDRTQTHGSRQPQGALGKQTAERPAVQSPMRSLYGLSPAAVSRPHPRPAPPPASDGRPHAGRPGRLFLRRGGPCWRRRRRVGGRWEMGRDGAAGMPAPSAPPPSGWGRSGRHRQPAGAPPLDLMMSVIAGCSCVRGHF